MTGPLYPPFYPPAYPLSAPPAAVPEQLTANGLDLNTAWCRVEGLESLFVAPARRGANAIVPGRHGVIYSPYKRYASSEVVVPIHVLGVREDGAIVPRAAAHLHENIDRLLHVFHDGVVQLQYTRGDGSSRSARAELLADPLVIERERAWPPLARMSVSLQVLDAFWTETEDVGQTITGATGVTASLTAFAGSTAPIADARLTFHGPVSNPRLAIGDRWVQFNGVISAGQVLVLECEHWRASSGNGAEWSPDPRQVYREPGPAWLEIPPSYEPLTATFTHTNVGSATVEIAGNRRFLTA
jgi:hypothetical protein